MAELLTWNGSEWVSRSLVKTYDGSAWQDRTGYVWNGSEWEVFNRSLYWAQEGSRTIYKVSASGDISYSLNYENNYGVTVDDQGNFYITEDTYGVEKRNPNGDQIWNKRFADYGYNNTDYAFYELSVQEDGYLYAAVFYYDGTDEHHQIMKINASDGTEIWKSNVVTASDVGYTLNLLANAGQETFLFRENSSYNVVVHKIDGSGNIAWTYDTGEAEARQWAYACDPNGGVYLGTDAGDFDGHIWKLTNSGSVDWKKYDSSTRPVALVTSPNYLFVITDALYRYDKTDGSSTSLISNYGYNGGLYTSPEQYIYLLEYSTSAEEVSLHKVDFSGNEIFDKVVKSTTVSPDHADLEFGRYGAFPGNW